MWRDQGHGTADHHLSEDADGAADNGGVEVLEELIGAPEA